MKTFWLFVTPTVKRLKIYLILLIFLLLLSLIFCLILKSKQEHLKHVTEKQKEYTKTISENFSFDGAKVVHLDLKGAPFRISYYTHLFPLLVKLGATGVLIEYEDMFPYSTRLVKNVSALNAYTFEDIHFINKLAIENNLEVIPLIQTFGHLEFLLKLEEFKDLREVFEYPQVICPTHEKTLDILMEMIEQVIELHPQSKTIHIGGDEVYYLGFCERCVAKMTKFNLSEYSLFIEHIHAVTSRISMKYPQHRILMWDDKLRSFPLKYVKDIPFSKNLVPVIWNYSKYVRETLGSSLWEKYSAMFPVVWVASAFKGASGSSQYVPDVTYYVENHRSWMSLISEYKNRFNFDGFILTGWQRYDHFAILCELLPVSLPSLAMSLRVVYGHQDSPLISAHEAAAILGCEEYYGLLKPVYISPHCSYIGGGILDEVNKLHRLCQQFKNILEDSRVKGWMSDYNKKHEFTNTQYVRSVTSSLNRIRQQLAQIDHEISNAMVDIYDNFTIDELRETYIEPFEKEIRNMIKVREKLLAKRTWPRRPLPKINKANDKKIGNIEI